MLDVNKMVASAESCMGWPYVSPGSNNQDGIDCSGLFVKIFRDQGASIYHGSNTIFHNYCDETGKLTSASQLIVGMAVFKMKAWTSTDVGNKWYGAAPGNLSHIGFVASVNPLRIIHASSVAGCVTVDTSIKKWAYWGILKNVNYYDPVPVPTPEPTPEARTMYVYSGNGKPVNMRKKPDLHSALVEKVPDGDAVEWLKEDGAWAFIKWHNKQGWMLDCYLSEETHPDPAPTPEPEPEPDVPVVEQATVWAENGRPVKLRAKPSTLCRLYDEVPCGEVVTVVEFGEPWCKVNYKTRKGWYMMRKFLSVG